MLPLIVSLPFLGALLAAAAERRQRHGAAWAAGLLTGFGLLCLLGLTPGVLAGQVLIESWEWVPALGLNLTFRLDGLSYMFALLVLAIGLLVVLYARYYLESDEPAGRFFGLLLTFMGAMLGLVLSGNLLQLAFFWEVTSLSSFLLIGFWRHRSDARQGARLALMITGGGGLALLGGVLIIGHIAGSFELSVVLAAGDLIRSHPAYPVALVLVLLGAFTKSAQFPFHFWLPHAMAAPTPVSAYLHSATMVKAGVFLIARLYPALSGTDLWFVLVSGTGMVTLVFAAYTALFQHDLKGLLAYSTISHLGLITLLFGLGTSLSELAATFHILNHATFKASLFMATGIIDHEAGTRDMRKLNGLFKYMPYTAILAIVAASSMAGVPLLNGFLSKEMFFGETLHLGFLGPADWLVPLLATVAGVFAVAYSARFVHDVFFNGEPIDLPKTPHEPPRWMKVPVEILVIVCLVIGIFPQYSVQGLLDVAAAAVKGDGVIPDHTLAVWHGFNLPLLMSLIAFLGGIGVYAFRHHLFAWHDRVFPPVSAKGLADDHLGWALGLSRWITEAVENGSVQRSVALLLGSTVIVAAVPFLSDSGSDAKPIYSAMDALSALGAAALVVGALAAVVMHRERYTALVFVGVVGLVTSLAFVRFAAPDLALTQLVVEVTTVILLLLVLFYLPQTTPRESSSLRRYRDTGLAAICGIGMTAITWALLTSPFESISGYFLRNSLPEGGGHNVVNVILADFRGFDTLGEAVVLAIAAIGIYGMLDGVRMTRPEADRFGNAWDPDTHSLILAKASRTLLPLALLVAVYFYLRGHNAPGGGFVAGLIVGTALTLQYMANGIEWAKSRLVPDYRPVVGLGVLVAGGTGLAAWVFGAHFLSHTFAHVHLPIVGEFELASAMLFEGGIFLAVVGTVLLVLVGIGQLSLTEPRVDAQGDGD